MMKKIDFSKMAATGNDFVVIDNRNLTLPARPSILAERLCNRKFGIGADGLILLEKSREADFRMRIFNPDGSEPDMCGNGSRCIALYAQSNRIASSSMTIQTNAGLLKARVSGQKVKINMTKPKDMRLDIKLELKDQQYNMHYIDTGVPHAICFVCSLDRVDMQAFGRGIRYHKMFMPKGANVNIVKADGDSSISIRTYERGVEAETLACGTGATASALVSSYIRKCQSPVTVHTKGGTLKIYFKRRDRDFRDVFLEGKAEEIFKGRIQL
jgi:diaminopimelate epimerase